MKYTLSAQDLSVASQVASKLGIPVEWLLSVIEFETAGTFDPAIKNPGSSARGLIQFMDATAKSLGYFDSLDLVQTHPTFADQLQGPVLSYFLPYRPFPTKQSFFMTVFYPKFRNVAPNTLFPDSVRAVNPGIDTVQSYVDGVDKKKTSRLKPGLGL